MTQDINDIINFHKSTSQELIAIKDRVRNLIGSQNWSDEGRYKEAVLRNVLRRVLPQQYTTATGYVVKEQIRTSGVNYVCSPQIDIMIIDSHSPNLFSEGDLYVTTPESIRAIIEVKTNIQNQNLPQIIKRNNKVGEFIQTTSSYPSDKLFNGIFSFEGFQHYRDDDNSNNRLKRNIENKIKEGFLGFEKKRGIVNFLCLNENLFLRREQIQAQKLSKQSKISAYYLEQLSFSWFISNLLSYLQGGYKNLPQFRVFFPISKKQKHLFDIKISSNKKTNSKSIPHVSG